MNWKRTPWRCYVLMVAMAIPASVSLALAAERTVEWKIQNAMSAAPAFISKEATILDWPTEPGGKMVVLRQGTNGWTCMPDRARIPGNDPMCHDKMWMKWMAAIGAREKPAIDRVGISYMLQGGAGADQTDPFAKGPPTGKDWIMMGPHIMVIVPNVEHLKGMNRDYSTGQPFTFYVDTPYEIIILPVGDVGETLSVKKAD